jgi:hypothetical protein
MLSAVCANCSRSIAERQAQGLDLFEIEAAFRAQNLEAWIIGAVDLDGLHHEVEMGVEGVHRAPETIGLAADDGGRLAIKASSRLKMLSLASTLLMLAIMFMCKSPLAIPAAQKASRLELLENKWLERVQGC